MTESDRKEIAKIVRDALAENGHCALGIKPETAHELISFADAWKHSRRYALCAVITVAVGGLLAALWMGLKAMVR